MNSWGFSGDGNYKKVTDRNDRSENISDIKDPLIIKQSYEATTILLLAPFYK